MRAATDPMLSSDPVCGIFFKHLNSIAFDVDSSLHCAWRSLYKSQELDNVECIRHWEGILWLSCLLILCMKGTVACGALLTGCQVKIA